MSTTARTILRDAVTQATTYSDPYYLPGGIRTLALRANTNECKVNLGRETSTSGIEWETDELTLEVGVWTGFDGDDLKDFQYFRTANKGSSATLDIRAVGR